MNGDDRAYPSTNSASSGLTKREWLAAHAPEPTKEAITARGEVERLANPHGDAHKPPRHSWEEIRCLLRWEWADQMIATSGGKP